VDRARAVELAVLHDACEAATGDLVPGEYASREEKLARERAGLLAMLEGAPDAARSRVLGAFDEMARDETPEARFVHEIDKLEMALQARRYQERGVPAAALESYRATARRGVASPALREALDALTSGPWGSGTSRGRARAGPPPCPPRGPRGGAPGRWRRGGPPGGARSPAWRGSPARSPRRRPPPRRPGWARSGGSGSAARSPARGRATGSRPRGASRRRRRACRGRRRRGRAPARSPQAPRRTGCRPRGRACSCSTIKLRLGGEKCRGPGSNRRPWDYESHALPAAPPRLVVRGQTHGP